MHEEIKESFEIRCTQRSGLYSVPSFVPECSISAIHRRKGLAIPFYSVVAYIMFVVLIIKFSGIQIKSDDPEQKSQRCNGNQPDPGRQEDSAYNDGRNYQRH